jgi:TetR/AcrR family transcriptional regulator
LRSSRLDQEDESDGSQARERILDAACHEFAHAGYGATTMRRIADRAGVAHPLINYYFGDKDGLWRASAERLYGGMLSLLDEELLSAMGVDGEERVRAIFSGFVERASEARLLTFFVETGEEGGDRAQWLFDTWVLPVQVRMLEIISDAQGQGVIIKSRPEFVYELLTGFVMADSVRALFPATGRGPADRAARAEELISFLIRRD